jgi:4-hydroxy-3-methylbut-2-enyl diphosphate reductase IspH
MIIGKKDHAEVIGLAGQTQNNAVIVSKIQDLEKLIFSIRLKSFVRQLFPLKTFIL